MSNLPIRVTKERWEQAQTWEGSVWQNENLPYTPTLLSRMKSWGRRLLHKKTVNPGDDWNIWWKEKFGNYGILPESFENAVELGSGPYTNIRLILESRSIKHAYCSDPLIKQYITFTGRWLAEAWLRGIILVDDHPTEDCPFASDYFDLVILINVLDHVMDSILCLKQAVRITKPNGLLIIGQDLTNIQDMIHAGEDIGHPIRIDQSVLDLELLPYFEPLLYQILSREEGRNPLAHYGTYLFIGKKYGLEKSRSVAE